MKKQGEYSIANFTIFKFWHKRSFINKEEIKHSKLTARANKKFVCFKGLTRARGRAYASPVKFVVTWNILKVIWYTSLKTGRS